MSDRKRGREGEEGGSWKEKEKEGETERGRGKEGGERHRERK